MSDNLLTGIVTIALGIIGLATLAVLVAPQAKTRDVIGAAGNALASNIAAAVAPVSGGGFGTFRTGASW
jgi:hypothetical protein